MMTEKSGAGVGGGVGEAAENAVESSLWEGLGAKLDEYSAWYNFVFPVC